MFDQLMKEPEIRESLQAGETRPEVEIKNDLASFSKVLHEYKEVGHKASLQCVKKIFAEGLAKKLPAATQAVPVATDRMTSTQSVKDALAIYRSVLDGKK